MTASSSSDDNNISNAITEIITIPYHKKLSMMLLFCTSVTIIGLLSFFNETAAAIHMTETTCCFNSCLITSVTKFTGLMKHTNENLQKFNSHKILVLVGKGRSTCIWEPLGLECKSNDDTILVLPVHSKICRFRKKINR